MTRLHLLDIDTGDRSAACAALARAGDSCAVLSPPSGDGGSLLLRWGELPNTTPQLRESYSAVFPDDGAPFASGPGGVAESEAAAGGGDERCFLVFFQIKPECVEAFRSLLTDECISVLAVEPRMLRYDLYQSTDDPCRFAVLELAADGEAMAAHEARRSDGTMRAALAQMEAVPRKAIAGTGPYAVQRAEALAWSPDQARLYMADAQRGHVYAYAVDGGALANQAPTLIYDAAGAPVRQMPAL